MDKATFFASVFETVRRFGALVVFDVIRPRWVGVRIVAWTSGWRRLVHEYERRPDVPKAMIHVAMGALLLCGVYHP